MEPVPVMNKVITRTIRQPIVRMKEDLIFQERKKVERDVLPRKMKKIK